MRRKGLLLTVVLLLVVSNAGTFLIATGRVPFLFARGVLPEGTPEYKTFVQVLGHIQQQFVDEERATNTAVLLQAATAGLVEGLRDPYSQYMTAEDYRRFMSSSIGGNYTGVGIEITAIEGYVTVIAPIKGTPAYRAGIMPQDQILAVDGRNIVGWTTQEASSVIRGAPGTTVVLTIRRQGVAQPIDVSIVREVIQLRTVEWKMLEPGIGYIQLTAFREDTTTETKRAVAELRGQGMRVLILDLRDNPGGMLTEAVEVSDVFVAPGTVVSTVYRDGRREDLKADEPALGLPLFVLINGASASAAEITAGAIQDRGAGTLVGVRSFGKATVQHLFNLPDGGGLKLTTARYLTPNGRDINRTADGTTGGISPDVEVQNLPAEPGQRVKLDDPGDARNVQLRRALELARGRI
jgi:carboxyl-terminal processing protease